MTGNIKADKLFCFCFFKKTYKCGLVLRKYQVGSKSSLGNSEVSYTTELVFGEVRGLLRKGAGGQGKSESHLLPQGVCFCTLLMIFLSLLQPSPSVLSPTLQAKARPGLHKASTVPWNCHRPPC